MDPISIAMLGGSVLSSVMGGRAANRTNKANQQIAMANLMEQRQARQGAEREARSQRRDQQLGSTDAAGNRTYFVPGQGWVTDLTQSQQTIQSASEAEQTRLLTTEAARNEQASARGNDRRNREDTFADETDRELRAARRPDEGQLRQLLLARGAETRNASADRAGENVARSAVRGGGTNNAQLLQGARAASDATSSRQAGIEAEMMARDMATREFAQDRDGATQMLDYFRKMSTGGTAAPRPVQPQGPAQMSTGVQDQGLLNLLSRTPPQQQFVQPNNAVAGTISDISSAFGAFNDRQRSDKMYDAVLSRMGSNTGAI
jgi:hypothetical protein